MEQTIDIDKKVIETDAFEISKDFALSEQKALLNMLEDMSDERGTLEDQQVAISNILEDVNDTQEKLKQRQFDLEVLQDLVQEMGTSLKIPMVMQRLLNALYQVLPHPVSFAYIPVSSDTKVVISTNDFFVHTHSPLGKEYLKQMQENLKHKFSESVHKSGDESKYDKWLEEDWKPVFIAGSFDDSVQSTQHSVVTIPFSVNNELLGVIDISSSERLLFGEREIALSKTITNTGATTIARLKQLFESEQSRIQSLVDSISNGVIMFDMSQQVTLVNPAAEKMTGLPKKGFYLSEFVKLFDSAYGIDEKIVTALKIGEIVQVGEIEFKRFTYESFIAPVRDYEKNVVGGAIILHDITHLKAIDKMKTEFVALASHQLRTPLTPIRLFSEMLVNGDAGELSANQREYVSAILDSAKRMISLVNDLLNVSRLETGRLKIEPVPTQIEDFIQDIVKEVEPVAKNKGCELIFEKPKEKLQLINIDPSLVRQVIHNLITNAVRYTLEKDGKIFVSVVQENSQYLISVKDNGIGIPIEVQSRIFEKFFRADNAVKQEAEGSGLGMYVAKMVAEASGGNIWFESPIKGENYGTIFYVSIPAHGMMAKDGEKGLAAEVA